MTRDYNKQRQDDMRPSFRNQSNGRYRDEQPPRPARPRLNRETVDRAWEAGAAMHHPDYRPRRSHTSNRQAPRNNWRSNQSSEHSPAQNGRKPFNNQTDHHHRFERTPDNSGFRSRSFNSDRGRFDDQRVNRRGSDQGRGYQRRNAEGYDRPPRGFEGRSRASGRDNDKRSPRNFEREGRVGYKPPTRNTQNPRWQSRPMAQRGGSSGRRSSANDLVPQSAQFEGDYEHFSAPEFEERHVTQLPDGRVLKGPRPAQRRNAEFWTGVAQETENLLDPIASNQHNTEATLSTQAEEQTARRTADTPAQVPASIAAEVDQDKLTTQRKPRARAASPAATRRKKKADTAASSATPKKKADSVASPLTSKKKADAAARPRSTGPRPSQRGYKWPAP